MGRKEIREEDIAFKDSDNKINTNYWFGIGNRISIYIYIC